MVSESTRTAIWGGMLTAEMNMLYWDQMIRRFNNAEFLAKIFLALTSSAVVGGWLFRKQDRGKVWSADRKSVV